MPKLFPAIIAMLLIAPIPDALTQDAPKDVREKIDELISGAYQTARAGFPCKQKPAGKARILRWQGVDRCLNDAAGRIDWEDLTKKLEALRAGSGRLSRDDFTSAVEASLLAHAVTFDQVFDVSDDRSLLPLTNSLLRFLPADSLRDLPVFDRNGTKVGVFAGLYTFERTGALASVNTYRLTLFQYEDLNGNVQSAADRLLLDSYGVPWREARTQRGYRLTSERLPFVR